MKLEIFLAALLIVSSLAALATEAVKKILDEHKKVYHTNTLAGICALVVSAIAAALYIMFTGTSLTEQSVAVIIALVLLSWLCAMVGYDKVKQALLQYKTYKKDE